MFLGNGILYHVPPEYWAMCAGEGNLDEVQD